MDIFLQAWGGIFYLLNKIFLSIAEGSDKERLWRIFGWSVYLLGLPAWLIILGTKNDWIVASIEFGGAPAMLLGLIMAIKGKKNSPVKFQKAVGYFSYVLLMFGVVYSLYHFGGLTNLSQILELGVTTGFLIGTYLLAQKNPKGWLWFGLMNGSNAALMLYQNKTVLFIQQVVSLAFVFWGFYKTKIKK